MSTSSVNELAAAAVETQLAAFLEGRTKRSWQRDTDMFASGAMTSLFAMELVLYVEQAFGVTVTGDELKLANFRSVTAMAALVRRLRTATGAGTS